VVGQLLARFRGLRQRAWIHERAVGEQLEGEHVDLLLALLALTDHVAEVVMRERRLDAVRGVVRERQRDRARRRDRAMVREARARLLELRDELGLDVANPLHVAAVARMQDTARNAIAGLVTV